ncbi:MAG: hypothetical protein ACYSTG_10765 [Planctomycetota bacterium]|jgi:hypothetical protein
MKILQAAFILVFASAALWQPPVVPAAEKKEPIIIGHDKTLVTRVSGEWLHLDGKGAYLAAGINRLSYQRPA